MKDETPKKKRVNKSKKAEKFTPNDNKDIQDLTQKALTAFLQDQVKNKSETRKNIEALTAVIEEFLASYIILGYTMDGRPMHIISAHNQQEADSLTTLINKFIMNCAGYDDAEE